MLMNSNEYLQIIETIKGQIKGAQYQAALNVNRELIMLYYHIGKVINEHKTWGSKFIENLAADIRISFPNVKGYSVRNLKYMAKFAETYPDEAFVQQAVAQIPWGHTVVLLDKFSDKIFDCKMPCRMLMSCRAFYIFYTPHVNYIYLSTSPEKRQSFLIFGFPASRQSTIFRPENTSMPMAR